MSKIYSINYLTFLRDSPLVSKPRGLPPTEQWMGLATDSNHSVTRRPAVEKHLQRNNAKHLEDSEEFIFVSPRTSTSFRNSNKSAKSPDRSGIQDAASSTKTKIRVNENDRGRDSRASLIRSKRAESEQGNESWSTAQPRKSFGGEDVERNMNLSGGDKVGDDKIFKEKKDYEGKETSWGSNMFTREKDIENNHFRERSHRNGGMGRGRNEASWFKEKNNHEISLSTRGRHSTENYVDRSRGWRGREKDDRADIRGEGFTEKFRERQDQSERRWDRNKDFHHENEPEWMDDPGEESHQVHTLADFEKWKEQMQGRDRISKGQAEEKNLVLDKPLSSSERPKVEIPLDFDQGLDKFLGLISSNDENYSDLVGDTMSERITKSNTTGKASRFTSFFTTQEESPKINSEPLSTGQQHSSGVLKIPLKTSAQLEAEKEAFQKLLQKLQRQTLQASSSNALTNTSPQLQPPVSEKASNTVTPPHDLYQNYSSECHDEGRSSTRLSQHVFQELFTQPQIPGSQSSIRPEQMLQELISQRQNALGQNSSRVDPKSPTNTNIDFLMGLMQSGKSACDSQQLEPIHKGIQPKSDHCQISQHTFMDLEQEIKREKVAQPERSRLERHTRPQPPPGFFEDSSFTCGPAPLRDRQPGNSQHTQIIQRPSPSGLEMNWERQAQLPASQLRHVQNIAPPPGLANNLSQVIPVPQQVFPPGFSMGNFPPPDVMSLSQRNIQMQPPPGFFNGPPHGFLPPTMGAFQGPESMTFGAAPFDGRGAPSQGTFRR